MILSLIVTSLITYIMKASHLPYHYHGKLL
ncbi:hypothetical protein CFP56_042053 [Quercus suber]|uniref:Uncharacterized protein n=1 Tax=Quercus suber TaxID=58331 RepID=A0AAW0IU84_QUESU